MEVSTNTDRMLEDQLTRLMQQYEQDVIRMCFMYLHDLPTAEDATQETFLKAYKSLNSFREECNEKTWLMRIAINTCKDIRRNMWFRFVDRHTTLESLPTPSTLPSEDSLSLTAEIMRLPSKQKEVILLYYYQGMTLQEISQILNISNAAISKRLKQARKRLHVLLEGGWGNE